MHNQFPLFGNIGKYDRVVRKYRFSEQPLPLRAPTTPQFRGSWCDGSTNGDNIDPFLTTNSQNASFFLPYVLRVVSGIEALFKTIPESSRIS
jgi:hypothetical protein